MKILHITYHFGTASDLNYVFKSLGHEITFFEATCFPYTITEQLAHQIWNERKDYFQSFDVIITSDTVALAFPFLLHFEELKPRLIIWICNRFNVCGMESVSTFVPTLQKYVDRVSMIPYIDYERVWCERYNIPITHETINPLGKHIEKYICNESIMKRIFCPLDRSRQTKSDNETVFIPDYHNNKRLIAFLSNKGISFVHGRYMDLQEIKPYKAVISLPDAFGKIFYHEAIQQNIAVLIPSPSFIDELAKHHDYGITSKQYESRSDIHVHCEYYKPQYDGCYIHFNSFEDLLYKLYNLDNYVSDVQKTMKEKQHIIHDYILNQWKKVLENDPKNNTNNNLNEVSILSIPSKVALYNGLDCHHEMVGHALEYCIEHNYTPIIYINTDCNYGWIDFYKEKYGNIEIYNHTEFGNNKDYSCVFVLTDDDWAFPENSVDKEKIICIDHWYKIRRHTNLKRVDIRPFSRTQDDKWVLPVYKIINKADKIDKLNITQTIHVACIGYGGSFDINHMKHLFKNFNNITFHIFNRARKIDTLGNNNIFSYNKETATNIINVLKICQYSILLPVTKEYHDEKMTGSIPLALATGCRIITTQKLKELYNFRSCMVIDPNTPIELPNISEDEINLVYEELQDLIKRRDMWYDRFISEM